MLDGSDECRVPVEGRAHSQSTTVEGDEDGCEDNDDEDGDTNRENHANWRLQSLCIKLDPMQARNHSLGSHSPHVEYRFHPGWHGVSRDVAEALNDVPEDQRVAERVVAPVLVTVPVGKEVPERKVGVGQNVYATVVIAKGGNGRTHYSLALLI